MLLRGGVIALKPRITSVACYVPFGTAVSSLLHAGVRLSVRSPQKLHNGSQTVKSSTSGEKMLRAPLLVTRHFRRRAVRARFAPSAGRPCSRGPGELSAAIHLHARIRQRRQTTARPTHAACDSALSRNSALPHERIAGRPLSRLRYLPRRCHFDPEMVDGPKKKHAKMPLRPRNGQKGRGVSVHFGVEVASTDHLLETESGNSRPATAHRR